jgi:hypothetical protein
MRHQFAGSLLIVCIAATATADEDQLVIDKFQFTWTVAAGGKAQFLIEKDNKSTKALLRHEGAKLPGPNAISMTLEDAQAVGAALARTDEFLEKMKGTKDQIETIRAGKINVDFATTDKGDFRVRVTPEKWMHVFATLNPADAKALAGPMKKAVQAGALVDRKIKL